MASSLINKSCAVASPSNIAFLKYWGKDDSALQWPSNDSISMTLSAARTITRASFAEDDILVINDSTVNRDSHSHEKLFRHLELLRRELKTDRFFRIETRNTFPTGAGIASSASGLSAVTIAVAGLVHDVDSFDELANKGVDRQRLAELSRLGSGSACRSVYGGFVKWHRGASPSEQNVMQIESPDHWRLFDLIVVLEEGEKGLGSTAAHARVKTSPFFPTRLAGLAERQEQMLNAIQSQDLEVLGPLLEQEALDIHNLIMSASDPHTYVTGKTTEFLTWLRTERTRGMRAWFTLDAGANVHVIVEGKDVDLARSRIESWLADTGSGRLIMDQIGNGPEFLVDTDIPPEVAH